MHSKAQSPIQTGTHPGPVCAITAMCSPPALCAGVYIADALSMPVHWYYDTSALRCAAAGAYARPPRWCPVLAPTPGTPHSRRMGAETPAQDCCSSSSVTPQPPNELQSNCLQEAWCKHTLASLRHVQQARLWEDHDFPGPQRAPPRYGSQSPAATGSCSSCPWFALSKPRCCARRCTGHLRPPLLRLSVSPESTLCFTLAMQVAS